MFFDFHIHENGKLVKEAERLGYAGVTLVISADDNNKHSPGRHHGDHPSGRRLNHHFAKLNHSNNIPGQDQNHHSAEVDHGNNLPELEILEKHSKIQILKGVEIHPKNPQDLKRKLQKFRKKSDLLLVHGGDLKINRAACENSRVDILSHPYRGRRDSGINHVFARKAAENRVAVEFNLKYLFKTRFNHRYRVLSQFRDILKLQRKFEFPLIITSGANSIYDLRSPLDIMALTRCFGMDKEEAHQALSETPRQIIETNKVRSRVIAEGVVLVE
jgi:ribonuclease P/MRP protein subunit RPP1